MLDKKIYFKSEPLALELPRKRFTFTKKISDWLWRCLDQFDKHRSKNQKMQLAADIITALIIDDRLICNSLIGLSWTIKNLRVHEKSLV